MSSRPSILVVHVLLIEINDYRSWNTLNCEMINAAYVIYLIPSEYVAVGSQYPCESDAPQTKPLCRICPSPEPEAFHVLVAASRFSSCIVVRTSLKSKDVV